MFKSTDAGDTWSAVANTGLLSSSTFPTLVVDPITPDTLYAGTDGGVFKSTDAGATWAAVNTGLSDTDVHALAIDPLTPTTLYAGTDGGGVSKSTDAGDTWTAVNTGLTSTRVLALAIDPQTPTMLYAGTIDRGVFSIQQVDGCIGDCDDSGVVRVNELVTLMNIGLGEAAVSACPNGVPEGAAVDIAWIIAAVGSGLHGCGG